MDLELYSRFLLALLAVLLLIGGAAWLARRFGLGVKAAPGRGRDRRLSIVEVLAVDSRRRLLLLRRDGREHLVLIGPTQDLLIERDIVPPAQPATAQPAASDPSA